MTTRQAPAEVRELLRNKLLEAFPVPTFEERVEKARVLGISMGLIALPAALAALDPRTREFVERILAEEEAERGHPGIVGFCPTCEVASDLVRFAARVTSTGVWE